MNKFKKTLVSLVMVLLLAVTIVPSTNVTVQAASVGKVTGLKAVYTKGQTRLTRKHSEKLLCDVFIQLMKSIAQLTVRNIRR